jgi:uncharacterized protein YcfL
MKKAIIIIISLFLLTGCGKENMNPVFNDSPLIGTWISTSGLPIFNISNLKNEGTTEKYYEYQEAGNRYIRRTYNGMSVTYQITFIDSTKLIVVPLYGGTSLEMLRAGN